jgi:hypothetical protein
VARSIDGRGAFGRFQHVLTDWPQDRQDWFAFSDDRRRGRARAWHADAGYRARPADQPHLPRTPVEIAVATFADGDDPHACGTGITRERAFARAHQPGSSAHPRRHPT